MAKNEKTLSSIFKHYYEEHPNDLEIVGSQILNSTISDETLSKVRNALLYKWHPDNNGNSEESHLITSLITEDNGNFFENTFHAFIHCMRIERISKSGLITAPNDPATVIGYNSDDLPFNLETLRIPDGVSTIADKSFFVRQSEPLPFTCPNLIIPRSVTFIGENAFRGLHLGSITFEHEKDDKLTICRGAFSSILLFAGSVKLPPSIKLDLRTLDYGSGHYGIFYNTYSINPPDIYLTKILLPEQFVNKHSHDRNESICLLMDLGIIKNDVPLDSIDVENMYNEYIEVYSQ